MEYIVIQTRTKKIKTSLSRLSNIPFFTSMLNFNDMAGKMNNDKIFVDEDYNVLQMIINLSDNPSYPISENMKDHISDKCEYYGVTMKSPVLEKPIKYRYGILMTKPSGLYNGYENSYFSHSVSDLYCNAFNVRYKIASVKLFARQRIYNDNSKYKYTHSVPKLAVDFDYHDGYYSKAIIEANNIVEQNNTNDIEYIFDCKKISKYFNQTTSQDIRSIHYKLENTNGDNYNISEILYTIITKRPQK